METSIDTTRWYDRIWAALMFFTRLPLWRLHQPPQQAYATVVEHWPLAGWLTGGAMAAVVYGASLMFPPLVAAILAVATRLLLTGALHEDGLADFVDGFGGGAGDRQRTLDIMKDSHIGTYGVLALVVYTLLLTATLAAMAPRQAAMAVAVADPYAKMLAAQLVMMMPYARSQQQAKAKTVYRRMSTPATISLAVQGLLPMAVFLYLFRQEVDWQIVVFAPCLVMYFLYRLIYSRLKGYTGDCCGAVFLLVELTTLMAIALHTL